METYMEYYGTTLDEVRETWREYLDSSIQLELIFEAIAIKENMEVDDEGYDEYLQNIISSYSSDEESVYETFGNGDAEKGKAYVQRMYLMNQALDFTIENANVEEG
jgi:FKBP-type peptidyl-prolyl cis-trans isomerase (trigger factor)